jgi:hypothetical protein
MELTAPLTPEEMARLKDWWSGQLSDGWGEGFEQRGIKAGRKELYIVPWSSGDNFFVDTEREFRQRLGLEPSVETARGYLIAASDGDDYIAGALHIERDDSLNLYPNDDAAARAAEADGVKLIYGMPFVPDGTYNDTPENRAAIGQTFEQRRLSLPVAGVLLRRLQEKLDKNYAAYRTETIRRDKTFLYASAPEIAAVRQSYEHFREDHVFTTGQAEFLLKLENPLNFLADRWSERQLIDIQRNIDGVFADKERHLALGGYKTIAEAPEPTPAAPLIQRREDGTTSVLDAIRRVRENPPEAKPKDHQPGHKKSGHDL